MNVQRKIEDRVKIAFSGAEVHDYTKEYLVAIRANLKGTESRFHNLMLLLFFLFAMFELLANASIAEVTIGPFKVSDFSLIYKIFPVIIAYFYYEFMAMLAIRKLLMLVHESILRLLYNPIVANELDNFLLPSSTILAERILGSKDNSFIAKLFRNLTMPLYIAMIFAPMLFEIYAFYRCFNEFGTSDIILWIVLFFSVLFLVQGFLFFHQVDKLYD